MSGTFKGFTDTDIERMKIPKDVNKNEVVVKTEDPEKIVDQEVHLQMVEVSLETPPLIEPVKLTENHVDHPPNDYTFVPIEKPLDIEQFQLQQKLIEEQNRKRKEMLARALEDREKRNAEEILKLENIKKELQTLDVQLSCDVSILRKQIDKSSLSYAEAEKNYHKIEMEFLAAKLHLQKEKERKEMLTEHLCTLISHNEMRKAKKLETLMDKLAYEMDGSPTSSLCDGVCEHTGKMLEIKDGKVIPNEE